APTVDETNGKGSLTGTAEPGSTVEIDINGDGTPDYTVVADPDTGNWTVDLVDVVIPDSTTVTATATDSAGNVSPEGSTIVDSVMNVAIDANSLVDTKDNTPIITGTMDTDAVDVTVTIGGKTYDVNDTNNNGVNVVLGTDSEGNGIWSLEIPDGDAIADGNNLEVKVTAIDGLGNEADASGTITIDTAAPGVVLPANPDDSPLIADVLEADLQGNPLSVSKTITFNEAVATMSLSAPTGTYTTTNGDQVTWALTTENGVQTLTATTNSGANIVATMVLEPLANGTDYTYTFTLNEALQHATSTTSETATEVDELDMDFGLTFTDAVGNESTENVVVSIVDDIPTLAEVPTTAVINTERYEHSFQFDAGEDGLSQTVISIEGQTFTYTAETNTVAYSNNSNNVDYIYNYNSNLNLLSVGATPYAIGINVVTGEYVLDGAGVAGEKIEDATFVGLTASQIGDNIIIAGDDLSGSFITAQSGNDIIVINENTDVVSAGAGDDLIIIDQNGESLISESSVSGQDGTDTYRILSDSTFTVTDFNADQASQGGDIIDLSQYLGSDVAGGLSAANLSNYISISLNSDNTVTFYIDKEGGLLASGVNVETAADSTITFAADTFSDLYDAVPSQTNEEAIQKLIANGNLIFTSQIKEDAQAAHIDVQVIDGDGDSAETSIEFSTVKPVVTFNNITINEQSPELSGYINQSGASIVVTIDGVDYTAINNQDGTWSLPTGTVGSDNSPLVISTDVDVLVTATNAQDLVGTDNGTIVYDITPPTVSFTDILTNESNPSLSGFVDDDSATVIVTIDGVNYTATNNGDGSWTLPAGTLGSDGNALTITGNTDVTVTATDSANNVGTDDGTISFDNEVPVIDSSSTKITIDEGDFSTNGIDGVDETVPAITQTGALSVNETVASFTLDTPTGSYTVNGEAVTWTSSTAGDGSITVTGTTTAGEVAKLVLATDGQYTFTLSESFDHSVQGEDALYLPFEVTAIDAAGNESNASQIVVTLVDDIAQVDTYNQIDVAAVNTDYTGDLIVDAGADGAHVGSITLDGITYVYDAENNSVSTEGSSETAIFSTYNETNNELAIETIKGETITVDMITGEYNYTTTGQAVVTAEVEEAPEVTLGDDNSLLGLIGADALGLINLSESQAFSATDANNDITSVVIKSSALIALGLPAFQWSSQMANEFGLNVNSVKGGILGLVGSSYTLTITSEDGSTISNQVINEFLGSVYTSSALSVGVASSLSITASDSDPETLDGTATSNGLIDLDVLDGLLSSSYPSYLYEGTSSGEIMFGDNTLNNRMYGYGGDDNMVGGTVLADLMRGGAGDDLINGLGGNDILSGGTGNDTLTGGDGNDIFLWEEGDAVAETSAPVNDIITDFNSQPYLGGGDILDLADMLQGEGRIGTNVGNLSNYLHFEYNGSDTIISVSVDGDFVGGYDQATSTVDQTITLQGVDLTAGFDSDSEIIESLISNGNLLVDELTADSVTLGGTTTIDVDIVDGDGDIANAAVDFDASGAEATEPTPTTNSAPIANAANNTLLGLVSVQALDVLNLENQAFSAMDIDNNLTSVVLNYGSLLNVDLTTLQLTVSEAMAALLGLKVETVNSSVLLGLVGASSTVTITAIDGGVIDNQAINELLATVDFDNTELLGLSTDVQVNVLSNMTITATDSEGLSDTSSLSSLVDASLLNGLLFNTDVVIEGTNGDDQINESGNNNGVRIYGYEGNDDLTGTDYNDLIRGGSGNDSLTGGAGNDVLIDGNGSDTFSAGAGDDYMSISGNGFVSIDGGIGTDTLYVDDGINLDFTNLSLGSVTNIEELVLGEGDTGNTITLTSAAVEALTDDNETLYITGDAEDIVVTDMEITSNTFTDTNGITYNEYSIASGPSLFIDEDVAVTVTP
ncbi:type I secretion C-terminal target domain-containing protein, partial [Psychromonas aquatilis]